MDNLKEGVDFVRDANGERVYVGDYMDMGKGYGVRKVEKIIAKEIASVEGVGNTHAPSFIRTTPELFAKSKKKNGYVEIGDWLVMGCKRHEVQIQYVDCVIMAVKCGGHEVHATEFYAVAKKFIELYEAAK